MSKAIATRALDGEVFPPGAIMPRRRQRVFHVATTKVGGIRFIRIGRLCLSFCITRKEFPQ